MVWLSLLRSTVRDLVLMEAFAAEHLIVRRESVCMVARGLADGFPEHPALGICFTLSAVASNLEVSIGRDGAAGFPTPLDIYRVVAVIAADIFSLEQPSTRQVTSNMLAKHWDETGDQAFRKSV
ncbi:hypothetical protein A8B78_21060 [Jannaschia sp. EhC01]|nr:hypothetical protein A8B78_21060 [Jannaschia sp. EhC01]